MIAFLQKNCTFAKFSICVFSVGILSLTVLYLINKNSALLAVAAVWAMFLSWFVFVSILAKKKAI